MGPEKLRPVRGRGQRAVRGLGPGDALPSLLSLLSSPSFFPPGTALRLLRPVREAVTVLAGPEQRCLRGSAMVRCVK